MAMQLFVLRESDVKCKLRLMSLDRLSRNPKLYLNNLHIQYIHGKL